MKQNYTVFIVLSIYIYIYLYLYYHTYTPNAQDAKEYIYIITIKTHSIWMLKRVTNESDPVR